MKKISMILAASLVLTSILTACGTQGQMPQTPVQPDATSPVTQPAADFPVADKGAISQNIRLDPSVTTDADSISVCTLIYEGLVMLDEEGEPQPSLARSWVKSEDVLNYIFELRTDVVFHDGTPFNADAVVANFNRWFDTGNSLHGSGPYPVWEQTFFGYKGEKLPDGKPKPSFDGIEKVNDYTVLIHLNRQDEKLLTELTQPAFAILGPAALGMDGSNYGMQTSHVSGTGPYKLASWDDSAIVLEPNLAYWGEQPGESVKFSLK